MRTEKQTSKHLFLAVIVTVFYVMLVMMTIAMKWEPWIIPLITTGMFSVWFLHIGRSNSEMLYENLCAGLILGEFFYFGVHRGIIFDIPAIACILILIFSMFDRKRLLYITVALYVLEMLYHLFILQSIAVNPGMHVLMRLLLGAAVVIGSTEIARYRINKRLIERKRYEDTFAQLETAGKQNAVFLSNVSHELRTPINMVVGLSEVVLEKKNLSEIREDVESIQMAGRRLSNLINNMLDYTEIVEGTLAPAKEEYRFTSVLNDVLTIMAVHNSSSQLEMVFDVDPKLPAILVGDAEKITHVLKILVENAIKFTEEGGINVCVEFRRESYGVNLVIDISDTGIGMTDLQLTQMYDDFYQADTGSSRLAGGLGLGLPIARGLLHAMGGFIYFEGKGSDGLLAHITIPQGVADEAPCMELEDPTQFCVACYFRPEKYSCDAVRSYYDRLIRHMMEGLGIEGYQAHNFDGLKKLQRTYKLTHVFIAQAEYEENRAYYEKLARKLRVVVIAERKFALNQDSRLYVIRKPFTALSVVNLLNGDMQENRFKEAQVAGRRPFSCEGVKVLAVDDEEMNLVVAKGVLGGYGIQVDTCLSGREAIDRCSKNTYDAVFLDHMMPGFDGVETLKRIRETNNGMYRDRPVIALTANTISGAREMFRNEGFSEFIPKPIERSVLERVLHKVLPEERIHYSNAPVIRRNLTDREKPAAMEGAEEKQSVVVYETEGKEKTVRPKAAEKQEAVVTFDTEREEDSVRVNQTEAAGEEPVRDAREDAAYDMNTGSALPDDEDDEAKLQDNSGLKEVVQEEEEDGLREVVQEEEEDGLKEIVQEEEDSLEETIQGDGNHPDNATEEDEIDLDRGMREEGSRGDYVSFNRLKRTGVNVKMGLDYCCGDRDFYLEMLQMFQSQSADKKAEINSLYEAANWPDYAVKVHALKSTSLTIGAERLSAFAKLLEYAGKRGDVEYIRRNHQNLMRMYEDICKSIAKL
jgi:signal transduction histidine kinase/CheY-like chemotaxis protein/HPt (histidine-containing phosphotransfer) domain-containing protein